MAVILVIDDEKEILELICDLLRKEGHEVLEAGNGDIGLQKAREQKPDLILCDILMPGMDGFAVLEEIRISPSTLDIPFIFLTVLNKSNDIVKGFDRGAQDYIRKPYDNKEVLARVRTHIELKKNREKLKTTLNKLSEELEEAEQEKANLKVYIDELKSDQEELHRKEVIIEKLEKHVKSMDDLLQTLKGITDQNIQN